MSRARIAVVDDDLHVRKAVSSLLRSLGHDASTFPSGDAFLTADVEVDCVLTDLHMPGRSGIDVATSLAGSAASPSVILMTAYPDPALSSRCAALGVRALLEKPLDTEMLIHAVERALLPGTALTAEK